ncbi:8-oxo-dGTP pyrophosphatase MutT (NUDIX family) [Streptomyces sp. B1I3]|nr:8-oxo-dGTP pyrophosphatase MutT (NUDIX family) [Streptomyces sp. B1I3]
MWEIPSGHVDAGESILGAARRDTREETGLTVSSMDRYLGHFDYENSRGTTTPPVVSPARPERSWVHWFLRFRVLGGDAYPVCDPSQVGGIPTTWPWGCGQRRRGGPEPSLR